MKTKELIDSVAQKLDKPKTEVKAIFDAIVEASLEAVGKNEEVELGVLGKIKVKETAARKARNPSTGVEIDVPAGRAPKFTFGKALKDAAKA